jgi:Tfp pilus assembly protein PilV
MRCHSRERRAQRGSQLAEALVIGIFILMIALALIDLIVMVMANNVNDATAKNAARAAANEPTYPKALEAAQRAVKGRKGQSSGFISSLILQKLDYTDNNIVSATTKMELQLPIPVPGIGGRFEFLAQATEPIVAH